MVPVLFFSQQRKKIATTKIIDIEEVIVRKKATGRTNDLSNVRILVKEAKSVASDNGGIEELLKNITFCKLQL